MTTAPSYESDFHGGLAERGARRVMASYGPRQRSFVRGQGTALFDGEGRPHLDFLSGLGVTSLGHAHPAVTAAVSEQAATLVHTSNLHWTEPAVALAEDLAEICGWPDARTFFAQCGGTANEAAIKLARRHGKKQHPDKVRVLTLSGSFHGRTLATLEATGQPEKHGPFEPLAGFVDTAPWDDPAALVDAVGPTTCAVLLEVVQGEGGVRPLSDEMLLAAREACDTHGALLIIDEVQTGIGRMGTWFAYQGSPVVPDVITVAKALANGLPIGACIARGAAAAAFVPGDHATTFGGNPVTAAAARAVIATMTNNDVLANVRDRSAQIVDGIAAMVGSGATGVRGRGLLLAITLDRPVAKAIEEACRDRFVLVNAVAHDAIRIAPPLNVSAEEVELALAVLADALHQVAGGATDITDGVGS
ncbi:MAG: acetylornithine/N-succinyldiaminopimelate aminotransferase [Glaciecola sp.]|jgi:acetylornithine/N-succinyldiaminopimelate aminotransferase